MESSEDDAGAPTNASRRASAREKDVGLAEDVNASATSSFQQKPFEARSSCQTPAMSEDNFDGDSVPSPSLQDVNTSTEAILDMIDEIVDGPGAPKRLPQSSEIVDALNEELAATSHELSIIQESAKSVCEKQSVLPEIASSVECTDRVPKLPTSSSTQVELLTHSDIPVDNQTVTVESIPASTSKVEADSDQKEPPIESEKSVVLNEEIKTPSSPCPSSSKNEPVQNLSDSGSCDSKDRTVKCVTSSDNRDNVTVESAESTSSDSSVSESKTLLVEVQTRSPLRRKLVRPVVSDRRPDTTVSSTVDSQSVNVPSTQQITSDNIAKDVTSSSDAVPTTHGNVQPEEIRNVSEINICKAETSVSPPKKIKLIRQKIVTGTSNRETSLSQGVLPDKEQCQSTSSDNNTVNLLTHPTESDSSQTQPHSRPISDSSNCMSENEPALSSKSSEKLCSDENSQSSTKCTSPPRTSGSEKDNEQLLSVKSRIGPPLSQEPSLSDIKLCQEAKQVCSLSTPNSIEPLLNTNIKDTESTVCKAQEIENKSIDYIPLRLSPSTKTVQYNELKPSSSLIILDKNKKIESESAQNQQKIIETESLSEPKHKSINTLISKSDDKISTELSNKSNLEISNTGSVQLSSKLLQSESITCESKCTEKVNIIPEPEIHSLSKNDDQPKINKDNEVKAIDSHSNSSEIDSKNIEQEGILQTKQNLESDHCENKSNIDIKKSDTEIKFSKSLPTSSKVQENETELDINTHNLETQHNTKPSELESNQTEIQLEKVSKSDSRNIQSESMSSEIVSKSSPIESNISVSINCHQIQSNVLPEDQKKVPPIKLNLSRPSISNLPDPKLEIDTGSINKNNATHEDTDTTKLVPKLTLKLKHSEEMKSPVPKLTIKALKPPMEKGNVDDNMDNIQQVPSVTKINIKPIVKPVENVNDKSGKINSEEEKVTKICNTEQFPCVTKLNIKPILKPPEKINDIHRKSSSSEISESEYSENDETTSTSDQASASDHGSSDVVPKVTIKLGKPGTESEGKFYTEKNVPKLTIKGIQQEEKLIISQSDDVQPEKVPKLTIKTVTKVEGQPLSPKLTIKPLKPPDSSNREGEIPKIKITTEIFSTTSESRESPHVPKITIKPVTGIDSDVRTPKKPTAVCESPEHIPVVTKLNIKPILKPTESGETSEGFDDKVPVVSKLNIKPVIKPKDNDLDSSIDDVPKITKLNIKPLKNPEEKPSENFKDCDELKAEVENSIPVVTKLNIKPIIKPQEEDKEKDSENQSSETGNSSDDNGDHIPVVTKLNIKPVIKPEEIQESQKQVSSSDSIPVVTKLNIKPLVKPGASSPASPKKEQLKTDTHSAGIPIVTKLNIKPVVRPDDVELSKSKEENEDRSTKNPPLLMKINMKSVTENYNHDVIHNESAGNYASDGLLSIAPKTVKISNEGDKDDNTSTLDIKTRQDQKKDLIESIVKVEKPLHQNCLPEPVQKLDDRDNQSSVSRTSTLNMLLTRSKTAGSANVKQHSPKISTTSECDSVQTETPFQNPYATREDKISIPNETHVSQEPKNIHYSSVEMTESNVKQPVVRQKMPSVQNCTLLKKLLENTKDSLEKNVEMSHVVNCTQSSDRSESTLPTCKNIVNSEHLTQSEKAVSNKSILKSSDGHVKESLSPKLNDLGKSDTGNVHSKQELCSKDVTKPLEIIISDKISNQSSGQDSPRIILKINKTDHGPSAKIITEDVKRPEPVQNCVENTQDTLNDKLSPKRQISNSNKKQASDTPVSFATGKRLRSSRIVESTEKSQIKRNIGKRPSSTETSPPQNKESEITMLQAKRLKLGQLLSGSSPLTVTPESPAPLSPTKVNSEPKPVVKSVNHSLLNNENCSKNGNSKLHNILSNLQVKQMQSLPFNNTNCSEKSLNMHSDNEGNACSISSSDTVETHEEKSHSGIQQMIIIENSDFRDLTGPEDSSQDPLEVDSLKLPQVPEEIIDIPKPVVLTPQPKKRGRPRKLPVSEGAKPPVTLPVSALEERPQRSLRLMRDRPALIQKPRGGRGRGRGARRSEATPPIEPDSISDETEEGTMGEIDPTSSRIKLPRMTEALDKMPSSCMTPLSSRRRNSSGTYSSGDTTELKIMLENSSPKDDFPNTPEPGGSRGRGGRGSRGGRGRTPRGWRRGRGGGRGAMYMKETLGIYGRVCGPATTTVQLFEEETCMMDDNATSAKPSHLLDEDSQGSVKSSTNESNKMKKSKFADLFDSSKVWTPADVKEYTWPPPERTDDEPKVVMMIQEQVAMFLGVKSFKRRYPELKRRTVGGEERDYVLSKGLVTEALCDLGITAVDASEVLDIMLSDYPHKYEEFRSHQRHKQLNEVEEQVEETKPEEKVSRVEMKQEKPVEVKSELPKIDPEKTRQDMAAAAIASASEWNARANAARRGACADLQSLTVLRARPRQLPPARPHLRPPAGFYPHALLPGQYQHSYRVYTPEQLRYFPLNTVLAVPPAPVSATDWSSESEPEWGSRYSSSDDSDVPTHHSAKRKKLTKVKRSSQTVEAGPSTSREESRDEVVDTCRACKLRLEANRKYTHERFLVCSNCNAKLHPSCVELNADTIRKCREYPWQCAECKTCCSCRQPADDDKMLFCDLCDRGFHIYCVGLDTVPSGRWHCVECAICKSCGARSPSGPDAAAGPGTASTPGAGPAEWHHQTRRGPGGHKVYSHSLCTPCARAYRIGRYCPLCERSFIGPKGTMQLVICKLCDRQLHQECVRSSVSGSAASALRVLDYTCGWCRRGGITSRAAAVRLAPRTIATLFMAKRRFNKYAHRQYMESRLRPDASDLPDASDPPDAQDPPDLV